MNEKDPDAKNNRSGRSFAIVMRYRARAFAHAADVDHN